MQHASPRKNCVVSIQCEMTHVPDRHGQKEKPDADKPFRSDNRSEPDDERGHDDNHQCARGKRHAGRRGIVIVKRLKELRHQDGAAEQDKAKKKEEYGGDGEISIPEQGEIDHWIFVMKLPHDSDD